eukprot:2419015-Rhodomonas_salina.2
MHPVEACNSSTTPLMLHVSLKCSNRGLSASDSACSQAPLGVSSPFDPHVRFPRAQTTTRFRLSCEALSLNQSRTQLMTGRGAGGARGDERRKGWCA